MGNKGATGPFAPLVVAIRNVYGTKNFNLLRGKAISLHSQGEEPGRHGMSKGVERGWWGIGMRALERSCWKMRERERRDSDGNFPTSLSLLTKQLSTPPRKQKKTKTKTSVIKEFGKSIGVDTKQVQGLIRLAKKNGEKLGFLA